MTLRTYARTAAALALSLFFLTSGFALAQVEAPSTSKVHARIVLNGAFAPSKVDFSESRKYTEFVEGSTIEARYQERAGPGADLGLEVTFWKGLGLSAGFTFVNRDGSSSFSSKIPHPLYFDRKRSVTGDLSGLAYKETAFHFDVAYARASRKWGYAIFGGVTAFKVRADLIAPASTSCTCGLEFTQAYPYDTVTLQPTPRSRFEDSPKGFNVGAGFDRLLGKRFALGAQVRFSRATARLTPSVGNTLALDAGGLQVGAGGRVRF